MAGKYISDIILERYIFNELNASEKNEVESLLKKDPALRERLASLKKSTRDILLKYDADYKPELLQEEVLGLGEEDRNEKRKVKKNSKITVFLFTVCIMAGVIYLIPPSWKTQDKFGQGGQAKDGPVLLVQKGVKISGDFFVKKEVLNGDITVAGNELLKVTYHTDTPGYGMIFFIQPGKSVELLYPKEGDSRNAARLEAKKDVSLQTYILPQRSVFAQYVCIVYSGHEFNAKDVLENMQRQFIKKNILAQNFPKVRPPLKIRFVRVHSGSVREKIKNILLKLIPQKTSENR